MVHSLQRIRANHPPGLTQPNQKDWVVPATVLFATQRQGTARLAPPNSSDVLCRPAADSLSVATAMNSHHSARFGNAMTWANLFRPLTEDFATAFFVRDMGGMGVPRCITAAVRGRDTYDLKEDPKASQRWPVHQFAHSELYNIRGLNWPNMLEEFLREVQSGPAVFVGPSLILGPAAINLLGRSAVMMGRSDLKQFNQAYRNLLSEWAKHSPHGLNTRQSEAKLAESLTKQLMKQMIQPHFEAHGDQVIHTLPVKTAKQTPYYERPIDQILHEFLTRINARYHIMPTGKKVDLTYHQAFEGWLKEWLAAQNKREQVSFRHLWRNPFEFRSFFKKRNGLIRRMDRLEGAFKQMVYLYNLHHMPFNPHPETLLDLTVKGLEGPGKLSKQHVNHFLSNMEKFPKFIADSLSQGRNQSGLRGLDVQKVLNAAKSMEIGLVKSKFITSILATIAGFWAVGGISWIAQHNRKYPANRHVQLDKLDQFMAQQQQENAKGFGLRYKPLQAPDKVPFQGQTVLTNVTNSDGRYEQLGSVKGIPVAPYRPILDGRLQS